MAPVTSGLLFSIGQLGLTQSVFTYFSDTYTYQMGSVLAGSNFMRYVSSSSFRPAAALLADLFQLLNSQLCVRRGLPPFFSPDVPEAWRWVGLHLARLALRRILPCPGHLLRGFALLLGFLQSAD